MSLVVTPLQKKSSMFGFPLLLVIFIVCCGFGLGAVVLYLSSILMKKNHLLYGPVYIPTKDVDLAIMIGLAELKPGQKVADLGSGDGKVIIALAQQGVEAHGYENSPSLVLSSRAKIHRLGLDKKAFIHFQDFWKIDFSQYDLIFMYTSQDTMERLEGKIQNQLKKGSRVVSNTFKFPKWKTIRQEDRIFVYQK